MCAMARPRKPLLSTDRIVETARVLVDAEGLAAVSTRRLAAELGVSGPSLYNHFRTKDQILEAVADSVSAQVDLSMFEDGRDWRTALHDWAVSYRSALRDHPNIVPVLATGPGRRPAGLRLADAVYGGMVDAGWPAAQATSIGALMRYFIMGSALGSFAGGFVDDESAYDPPTIRILGRRIFLPSSRRRWMSGRLRWGLAALLDGLAGQFEEMPAVASYGGRGSLLCRVRVRRGWSRSSPRP
jgi:AcrR family transcriptional regulator